VLEGNDKIAASAERLCNFLVIALSRPHETLFGPSSYRTIDAQESLSPYYRRALALTPSFKPKADGPLAPQIMVAPLTSISFPSHLNFKSKRIVNLNGGIPTDLAVPTTRCAPAFIDSRFDLVHRHNAFTRILDGNLMPPTIDTTELQNVPASFCPGHLNTRSLELCAGEPRT